MATWQATLELAEINAPHGFMRYYRSDITAVMAGSPSLWRATQYLMGNHTIAERMFRHDPSVMLHAPLRTLLYADPDGDTKLAIDQPSLLFASYDNPHISEVGRELDALLAQLITLLGDEQRQVRVAGVTLRPAVGSFFGFAAKFGYLRGRRPQVLRWCWRDRPGPILRRALR